MDFSASRLCSWSDVRLRYGTESNGDEPGSAHRGSDSAAMLREVHSYVEDALGKLLPQALQAHYDAVNQSEIAPLRREVAELRGVVQDLSSRFNAAEGTEQHDTVALRSEVNSELNFPSNFEGLVLGCIDADFCK